VRSLPRGRSHSNRALKRRCSVREKKAEAEVAERGRQARAADGRETPPASTLHVFLAVAGCFAQQEGEKASSARVDKILDLLPDRPQTTRPNLPEPHRTGADGRRAPTQRALINLNRLRSPRRGPVSFPPLAAAPRRRARGPPSRARGSRPEGSATRALLPSGIGPLYTGPER